MNESIWKALGLYISIKYKKAVFLQKQPIRFE